MVMPTTSYPWSLSISAVTVLSIPPLIATSTFPFRLMYCVINLIQVKEPAKIRLFQQDCYFIIFRTNMNYEKIADCNAADLILFSTPKHSISGPEILSARQCHL